MSRLPSLRREDLSPEHHHAWDEIARTHRGNVNGPFSALIHVPPMGLRVSELEGYFRFEGRLSPVRTNRAAGLTRCRESAPAR